MKNLIIGICFLAFGLSLVLSSCRSNGVTTQETAIVIRGRDINIYVIDGCEYIGTIYGGSADVLTHKGNCKFCLNREGK